MIKMSKIIIMMKTEEKRRKKEIAFRERQAKYKEEYQKEIDEDGRSI